MTRSEWHKFMKVEKEHNRLVDVFSCCTPDDRLRLIFKMLLLINERLDHIEQQTKPSQKS